MIVEFYVNYLKNYYSDTYDINNNYENCDDYFNLYNNNYDELKNILSDKIGWLKGFYALISGIIAYLIIRKII